jgi:hypothetical protein
MGPNETRPAGDKNASVQTGHRPCSYPNFGWYFRSVKIRNFYHHRGIRASCSPLFHCGSGVPLVHFGYHLKQSISGFGSFIFRSPAFGAPGSLRNCRKNFGVHPE